MSWMAPRADTHRARRLRWSFSRAFALCGLFAAGYAQAQAQAQAPAGVVPLDEESSEAAADISSGPPSQTPAPLADALPTRLEAQIAFTELIEAERYEEAAVVGTIDLDAKGPQGVDHDPRDAPLPRCKLL